jgi:hypothetical protein
MNGRAPDRVTHRVQNDDGQKAAQPQVRTHDPMHRRPGFGRTSTSP